MYAIVLDESVLSDPLSVGTVGTDIITLPSSMVSTSASADAASAGFYLKLLAKKKSPEGGIFEVIEKVTGAFDTWLSGVAGVRKATLAEVDVEYASPTYWRPSPFLRSRMSVVKTDVPSEALADNPVHVRSSKIVDIDTKTREIIAQGFGYNGKTFSLSDNAQRTFLGMYVTRATATYPISIPTLDDTGVESLADSLAVEAFYSAMESTLRSALESGVALKQQVMAAATEADVKAVQDNR